VLVRRAACRTAREYLNCELPGGGLGAFGKLRTEAIPRLGAHAHTKALIDLVRLTLKRLYLGSIDRCASENHLLVPWPFWTAL
jgi:hypothetical protein